MTRAMFRRDAARIGLMLLLSGCSGAGRETGPAGDRFDLVFEEVEAPEVFASSGPAERAGSETPGFWAAVPGLPQAELGAISNLGNGARVRAALFTGSGGSDAVWLSERAAEVLGIGAGSRAEVAIVALRRRPRLVEHNDAF
jgi:hypothetical protein